MENHYSMLIKWSDEDQCFIVLLPEWEERLVQPSTGGKTYAEAAEHGADLLESIIGWSQEDGEALPPPQTYP